MEGREPSYKSEEQDEFYNSNESLHELQQFVRKRTISGTHSDRSTGSLKELIFIKSIHEHQTIGNEGARLFFCQITTSDQPIKENIVGNHAKVPFSVTSIIPWQKAQNRTANNRYLYLSTYIFSLTLKSVKKSSGSEKNFNGEKEVVKHLSSKKQCFF